MKNDKFHTKRIFIERRRVLRSNATPQEILLWLKLRLKQLGCKFQRQHSIGGYIVDFYCAEKRLIIEIDGSQHLDNVEYDRVRDDYFESLDYKVLRFWNNEVNKNIEGVLLKIRSVLDEPYPTQHPAR